MNNLLRNLTAALKGNYVGVKDLGNGIWKIFYRNVFLGFFNETKNFDLTETNFLIDSDLAPYVNCIMIDENLIN